MTEIIEANLAQAEHAQALLALLDEYAHDPMGGGKGLSAYAKENLVDELGKRSTVHVVLAYDGKEAVGLAICMEGFSTFACKPLLNIHDVVVSRKHRGKGISKLMLSKAEEIARRLGCCKLTLEVLEGNHVARAAYLACGFSPYELAPEKGRAMFWEKKLD